MLELRSSLKERETLCRAGAMLYGHVWPEELSDGPEYFAGLMMDLQRGLIIKVFVEIAASDRRWNQAEREAALIVLQYVWGDGVHSRDLREVLQCRKDLPGSLSRNKLPDVFIRIPPLSDQIAELDSLVMRIANIIAKADGTPWAQGAVGSTPPRSFSLSVVPLDRTPENVTLKPCRSSAFSFSQISNTKTTKIECCC